MNKIIKNLITVNIDANKNIKAIEESIQAINIVDDRTKADYGNLCIALRGYRMVADATECILINANILKDDEGNFYEKIASSNCNNCPCEECEDDIHKPE